jgi:HAD superfamily hydrolase (TIGR01509 family)
MIRGLVFDFDGLILETEEPIFRSWQEIYQEYGCQLAFQDWAKIIGTADTDWHPLKALEQQLGRKLEHQEAIIQRQRQRELELILSQPVLPGVRQYLQDARGLGLKIGLASSSTCDWVAGHLDRLGLQEYFDVIRASNDVKHTKPDPALYCAAVEGLGIQPKQAVAFEDSPNGILAAKRAGLWCVAVPNVLTRQLPINHADLQLESLAAMSLESLLEKIEGLPSREIGFEA